MSWLDFREPFSAWSHAAGFMLALPGTVLLWGRSSGSTFAKRVSVLIFGLSLAFCYAASTIYHGSRVPEGGLSVLNRLDHVGILVLIAGSYTPLVGNLMRGWWRRGVLLSVWLVAAAASGALLLGGSVPLLGITGLYLMMGWGIVVCYSELARVVSHRALRPLVTGGLLYSTGAALNALRLPRLWPETFGSHELFHLFVLAGSLSHYRLILNVVIPIGSRAGADLTWPNEKSI
jgi:hemolysin III